MKKFLALLLVFVLMASILVSCGDEPDPTPANPDPSEEEGEEGGEEEGGSDPAPAEEADWWDDIDFDGKEVVIQLSSLIDSELPNGCQKYMVGPDKQLDTTSTSSFERVQNAVYLRNKTCASAKGVNLTPRYVYIDNDWGHIKSVIVDNEQTYGSGDEVDLYCNIQYDMFSAACEDGVFANLLNYTVESGRGYFSFSKANGYYMDYMDDNTLSSDRLAIIASDYFMDVLRAMTILPFNMEIYTSTAATDDPDCSKFYEMIIDGEWTWEKLMTYQNVFSGTGTATAEDTLLLTWASGGASANAFLYSTSYQTYEINDEGVCEYKETCNELLSLFQVAHDLMNTNGVLENRGNNIVPANELFTGGTVLFGTPNLLGMIEEDDFQSMTGLSIIPVPKLSEDYDYATLLNSRARVGAISYHSLNRYEISTFVQYMTENSDTVKDEYFNKAMNGKYLVGSGAGEILTLIYDCIGSNKSSTLDNLARAYNWNVNSQLWTALLIGDSQFGDTSSSISSKYASARSSKQMALDAATAAWLECAD